MEDRLKRSSKVSEGRASRASGATSPQIRNQEKAKSFLGHLRTNGGMVVKATEAAGLSLTSLYALRRKDPEFATAWDDAIRDSTVILENEITRRAVEGVEEPVFHRGEVVGHVRKYSDNLLMFMTKARDPDKYRERTEVRHTGEIAIKAMTDDQLAETIAKLLKRL